MSVSQVPTLYGLGSIPEALLYTATVLLALAWISVILRVWVRGAMIRSFGWDDWTVLLAMAAFTVQCSYMIKMALIEMEPTKNTNLPALSSLVTDVIAFSGSYAITCVFLKISLGLFFLRIIVEPWQRYTIYISLFLSTVYGLTYFGLVTFGCGNPANFLIKTIEDKCISIPDVIIPASYVHTALNAVVDWILAILPIFSLWKLQLPRMTKFWAYALLLLGALGSVASLVRFKYTSGLNPGYWFFRTSANFAIWSTIEPGLGLTAVCFATLRPLFRRCLETARSVSGTQRSIQVQRNTADKKDIQLKGLGGKSPDRQGFQPFESDDTQVWTEISVPHDLEKGDRSRWV